MTRAEAEKDPAGALELARLAGGLVITDARGRKIGVLEVPTHRQTLVQTLRATAAALEHFAAVVEDEAMDRARRNVEAVVDRSKGWKDPNR